MAAWLEPLKLEPIFVNIFAGDPTYFTVLALIIISAVAGFFRMTTLTLFFMIGLFIFMFSGVTTNYFLVLFSIIAGLVVGFVISKITER